MVLEARAVKRSYVAGGERIDVLDRIDLFVDRGEFLVIRGSSGSGKTTLLSVLSGLEKPSSGTIILAGTDITNMSEEELAPIRNRDIGFVFQNFHLIPSLNCLENVMFPAELHHSSDARARSKFLLEQVGLGHRQESFPSQLSGGEQQRCAICRALINRPALIFADEPTGNLDGENSRRVADLLIGVCREQGTTLVLATHSRTLAEKADRSIELQNGQIAG